jgi:hypothetical protein
MTGTGWTEVDRGSETSHPSVQLVKSEMIPQDVPKHVRNDIREVLFFRGKDPRSLLMQPIIELFREAEIVNQRYPTGFICNREKQNLREQWILGKFCRLYNTDVPRQATYARRSEQSQEMKKKAVPDFEVFDDEGKWLFDLEVTEALDAGRKRTDEYGSGENAACFIPPADYLNVVQTRICEKFSKQYPRTTILVIYINVFSSIYDDFQLSDFSSLNLPEHGKISQVWLLSSGGDKILQIG